VFTPKFGKSHRDSKAAETMSSKDRSESANSNAGTRIGFLRIAPTDKDRSYDRHQDGTWWTLQKGKD